MQRKQEQQHMPLQWQPPFRSPDCQEWGGISGSSSAGVTAAASSAAQRQPHLQRQQITKQAQQQGLPKQWYIVNPVEDKFLEAPRPWLLERQGEAAASSTTGSGGADAKGEAACSVGNWTQQPAATAKVIGQRSSTVAEAQNGTAKAPEGELTLAAELETAVGWALPTSREACDSAGIIVTRARSGPSSAPAAGEAHDEAVGAAADAPVTAKSEDASRAEAWLHNCISCYEVCVAGLPASIEDVHDTPEEKAEDPSQETQETLQRPCKTDLVSTTWSSRGSTHNGQDMGGDRDKKAAECHTHFTDCNSDMKSGSKSDSIRGASNGEVTLAKAATSAAAPENSGSAVEEKEATDGVQGQNGDQKQQQQQHLLLQPEKKTQRPEDGKAGFLREAFSSEQLGRQTSYQAPATAGRGCNLSERPTTAAPDATAVAVEEHHLRPLRALNDHDITVDEKSSAMKSETSAVATERAEGAALHDECSHQWRKMEASADDGDSGQRAAEMQDSGARPSLLPAALKQQLAAALEEQQRENRPTLLQLLRTHDIMQLPPHLRTQHPKYESLTCGGWRVQSVAEEMEGLDSESGEMTGAGAASVETTRTGSSLRRKQRSKAHRSPARARQGTRQAGSGDVSTSCAGGVAATSHSVSDDAQDYSATEGVQEGNTSPAGATAGGTACIAVKTVWPANSADAAAAAGKRGLESRQDLKRQMSNFSDATTCCNSSSVWSSRRSTLRGSETGWNQDSRCVSRYSIGGGVLGAASLSLRKQQLLQETPDETAQQVSLHASQNQLLGCTSDDSNTGPESSTSDASSNSENPLTERQQHVATGSTNQGKPNTIQADTEGAACAIAVISSRTRTPRGFAAEAGDCLDARGAASEEQVPPPAVNNADTEQLPRMQDESGQEAEDGRKEAAQGRRLLRLLSISLPDLEEDDAEFTSQSNKTGGTSTSTNIQRRKKRYVSEQSERAQQRQQEEEEQERFELTGQTQGATAHDLQQKLLTSEQDRHIGNRSSSSSSEELNFARGSDEESGSRFRRQEEHHVRAENIGRLSSCTLRGEKSQPSGDEDAFDSNRRSAAGCSSDMNTLSSTCSSQESSQLHETTHVGSHTETDASGSKKVGRSSLDVETASSGNAKQDGVRATSSAAEIFLSETAAAESEQRPLAGDFPSSSDAVTEPTERDLLDQPPKDVERTVSSSTDSPLLKLTDVWLPLAPPTATILPTDPQRTPVVSSQYSELYTRSVVFTASRSPAAIRPLSARRRIATDTTAAAATCRESTAGVTGEGPALGSEKEQHTRRKCALFERRWDENANIDVSDVAAIKTAASTARRADQCSWGGQRVAAGQSAFVNTSQCFMLPPAATGGGRMLDGVQGGSCYSMREPADTCNPKDASTMFVGVRTTLLRVLEDLHTSCCCCGKATAQQHPTVRNPCCPHHFSRRPPPSAAAVISPMTTAANIHIVAPAPAPTVDTPSFDDSEQSACSVSGGSSKAEAEEFRGDCETQKAATTVLQQQKHGDEEARKERQHQGHLLEKEQTKEQRREKRSSVSDMTEETVASSLKFTDDKCLPQNAEGAAEGQGVLARSGSAAVVIESWEKTSAAAASPLTQGMTPAAAVRSEQQSDERQQEDDVEQQALHKHAPIVSAAEARTGVADGGRGGANSAATKVGGVTKQPLGALGSEAAGATGREERKEENALVKCPNRDQRDEKLFAKKEAAAAAADKERCIASVVAPEAAAGSESLAEEVKGEEDIPQDGMILVGDDALLSTRGSSYADETANTDFAQQSMCHTLSCLSVAASFVKAGQEPHVSTLSIMAEEERPSKSCKADGESEPATSAAAPSSLKPQGPSLDFLPTPSSLSSSSTSPVSLCSSSESPCCNADAGAAEASALVEAGASGAGGEGSAEVLAGAPTARVADALPEVEPVSASETVGKEYLPECHPIADTDTPVASAQEEVLESAPDGIDGCNSSSNAELLNSAAYSNQNQLSSKIDISAFSSCADNEPLPAAGKSTPPASNTLVSSATPCDAPSADSATAAGAAVTSIAGSEESSVSDVAEGAASDVVASSMEKRRSNSASRLTSFREDMCGSASTVGSTECAPVQSNVSASAALAPDAAEKEVVRETGESAAVRNVRDTAAPVGAGALLHGLFYYHADQLRSAHLFVELMPYVEVFRPCLSAYVLPSLLPKMAQHLLVSELQQLRAEPSRYLTCNAFQWTGKPGAFQCMEDARLMLSSQDYLCPPLLARKTPSKTSGGAGVGGAVAMAAPSPPQTRRQALAAEQQHLEPKESATRAAAGSRSVPDELCAAADSKDANAAADSTYATRQGRALGVDRDVTHTTKVHGGAATCAAEEGEEETGPMFERSLPSTAAEKDHQTWFSSGDAEEYGGVSMLDPAIFFCVAPGELAAEKASLVRLLRALRHACPSWGAQHQTGFAYHLLQLLRIDSLQSPLLHAYKIVLQQLQAVPPRLWTLESVLDVLQDLDCIRNIQEEDNPEALLPEQKGAATQQKQQYQRTMEQQEQKHGSVKQQHVEKWEDLTCGEEETTQASVRRGFLYARAPSVAEHDKRQQEEREIIDDAELQKPMRQQLREAHSEEESIGTFGHTNREQRQSLVTPTAVSEKKSGRAGVETADIATDYDGTGAAVAVNVATKNWLQQEQQQTERPYGWLGSPQQAGAAREWASTSRVGDESEYSLARVHDRNTGISKPLRSTLSFSEGLSSDVRSNPISALKRCASSVEISTNETATTANCRRLQELLQLLPPEVFTGAGRKADADLAGEPATQVPARKYLAVEEPTGTSVGRTSLRLTTSAHSLLQQQIARTHIRGQALCTFSNNDTEEAGRLACNRPSAFRRRSSATNCLENDAALLKDFHQDDNGTRESTVVTSLDCTLRAVAKESYEGAVEDTREKPARREVRRASECLARTDTNMLQEERDNGVSTADRGLRMTRGLGSAASELAALPARSTTERVDSPQLQDAFEASRGEALLQQEQQSVSAKHQQKTGHQQEHSRERKFAQEWRRRGEDTLWEAHATEHHQRGQLEKAEAYNVGGGFDGISVSSTLRSTLGVRSARNDIAHDHFYQAAEPGTRLTFGAAGAEHAASRLPANPIEGRPDGRDIDVVGRKQGVALLTGEAGAGSLHAEYVRLQKQQHSLHSSEHADRGASGSDVDVGKLGRPAAAQAGGAAEAGWEGVLEALRPLLQAHDGGHGRKSSHSSINSKQAGNQLCLPEDQQQQLLALLLQLTGCCRTDRSPADPAVPICGEAVAMCRQQLHQRLLQDSTEILTPKWPPPQQDTNAAAAVGTRCEHEEEEQQLHGAIHLGAGPHSGENVVHRGNAAQPLALLQQSRRMSTQEGSAYQLSRSCTAPLVSYLYQTLRCSEAQERSQPHSGPFTRSRSSVQLHELHQEEMSSVDNQDACAYMAQGKARYSGRAGQTWITNTCFDIVSPTTNASGGPLDSTLAASYTAYKRSFCGEDRGTGGANAGLLAYPPISAAPVDEDLRFARDLSVAGMRETAAAVAATESLPRGGAGRVAAERALTTDGGRPRARREDAAPAGVNVKVKAANNKGSKRTTVGQRGKVKPGRSTRKGSLSPPKDHMLRKEYSLRAAELPKIKGVFIGKKNTCWVAQWIDDAGQPRQSCFNIRQHGFDKARSLAIEARRHYMGISAAARARAGGSATRAANGSKRWRATTSALPITSPASLQLVSTFSAELQQAQMPIWPTAKASGTDPAGVAEETAAAAERGAVDPFARLMADGAGSSCRVGIAEQLSTVSGIAPALNVDDALLAKDGGKGAEGSRGHRDSSGPRAVDATTAWYSLQQPHQQQLALGISTAAHRQQQRGDEVSSQLNFGRVTHYPALRGTHMTAAAEEGNAACSTGGADARIGGMSGAASRRLAATSPKDQLQDMGNGDEIALRGPSRESCNKYAYVSPTHKYLPLSKRRKHDRSNSSNTPYCSNTVWQDGGEDRESCQSRRKSRCCSSLPFPSDATDTNRLPHLLQRTSHPDQTSQQRALGTSIGTTAEVKTPLEQHEEEKHHRLRRNSLHEEHSAFLRADVSRTLKTKTVAAAATATTASSVSECTSLRKGSTREAYGNVQHVLGTGDSLNSNMGMAGDSEEEEEEARPRRLSPAASAASPALLSAAAMLASSRGGSGTSLSSRNPPLPPEILQQQLLQVEQLQRLLQQHGLMGASQQETLNIDQRQNAAGSENGTETTAASSALSALLSCLLESSGGPLTDVPAATTTGKVSEPTPFLSGAARCIVENVPGATSACAYEKTASAALAAGDTDAAAAAATPTKASAACALSPLRPDASSSTRKEKISDPKKDLRKTTAVCTSSTMVHTTIDPLVDQPAAPGSSGMARHGSAQPQQPHKGDGRKKSLPSECGGGDANEVAPTTIAAAAKEPATVEEPSSAAGGATVVAPGLRSDAEVTSDSTTCASSSSASSSAAAAADAPQERRPWAAGGAGGPLSLSAALLSAVGQQPQATPTATGDSSSSYELERCSTLEASSEIESSGKQQQTTSTQKHGRISLASLAREFPAVNGITYNVKCASWEAAVPGGAITSRRATAETAVGGALAASGTRSAGVGACGNDLPPAGETAAASRDGREDKAGIGATAGGKRTAQIVKIFSTRKLGGLQEAYETAVSWREKQLAATAGRALHSEEDVFADENGSTSECATDAAGISASPAASALDAQPSTAAALSSAATTSLQTSNAPEDIAVSPGASLATAGTRKGKRQQQLSHETAA